MPESTNEKKPLVAAPAPARRSPGSESAPGASPLPPVGAPPTLAAKRENLWINLGCNLVAPILILSKGTEWLDLSAGWALVVALAFPFGYGLWDRLERHKWNFLSALGLVSTLVKGSIGLFNGAKEWVAVNEAALPLIFGGAVLLTVRSAKPLVRVFLYNEEVFDVPKIDAALREHSAQAAFDRLMRAVTGLLAGSFFLSALLNYAVARYFIQTDPALDKVRFLKEMALMQGWSWIIIVLPSMAVTAFALWRLLRGLKDLTGLGFEECLRHPPPREK